MVIVGSYGWGTHCDRRHVWAEREAVVWSYQGSAADPARAPLELLRPGTHHPARGAPSGLWLPPGLAARNPPLYVR
ncbi:hypothetical protein [Gandjariella thermophila]|uniref:Uncharacterized protein n=1 Tax=Gandjariella thermophila TaxID=1931992 RepID=A0A4D4J1S3_9PSEU|nr:hypothetical protein [Gandjariella thermophila]GDY28476.1 hypothetical protein GTS_01090 [Gandjariella thermophila]